jgi:hypothetical protein
MQGISELVEEPPAPFQEGLHSMEYCRGSGCYPEFLPPKNEEIKEKPYNY